LVYANEAARTLLHLKIVYKVAIHTIIKTVTDKI